MSQNSAEVGGGWFAEAGRRVCLKGEDFEGSPALTDWLGESAGGRAEDSFVLHCFFLFEALEEDVDANDEELFPSMASVGRNSTRRGILEGVKLYMSQVIRIVTEVKGRPCSVCCVVTSVATYAVFEGLFSTLKVFGSPNPLSNLEFY